MRANPRSILLTLALVLAVAALVGCGSSASAPADVGAPIPAGGESRYGSGPSAAPSAATAPDGNPTQPDEVGNQVDDAKIVRTGEM